MASATMPRPGVPRPPGASGVLVAVLVVLLGTAACAAEFAPERIKAGAAIFARNCSPCHGSRMQNPTAAFDLRTFPPDEHDRFVTSVTHGKDQMPAWGDLLDGDDIAALWAYVMAGEKH